MPPRRATTVEIAADWVAAVDAGLTPAQQRQLDAWLDAEPSHRAAYERLDGQYKAADRLSDFRPVVPGEIDLPLLDDGIPSPYSRMRDEDDSRSRTKVRLWTWIPLTLSLVIAGYFSYFNWWVPTRSSLTATSVTSVGEFRSVSLPDGSVVKLNTDSAVAVQYTRRVRRVELVQGEAFFNVAEHSNREFEADVGKVTVRATRAAFNIRRKGHVAEIVVTEGMIYVTDRMSGHSVLEEPAIYQSGEFEQPVLAAGESVVLLEGEGGQIARAKSLTPSRVFSPSELTSRLAWHDQNLVFEEAPLRYVVAEFNRYNRRQLQVVDDAGADPVVSGKFKPDDIEGLAKLAESKLGMVVERRDDTVLLKRAPR